MPYVLKTDPLPAAARGQEITVAEPAYYHGETIAEGDEAFVWYSNDRDPRRNALKWTAVVLRVERRTDRQLRVLVRLMAEAGPNAPSIADLMPFRCVHDSSAYSGLARKLYGHSHNKVAQLTEDEAALLRGHFLPA